MSYYKEIKKEAGTTKKNKDALRETVSAILSDVEVRGDDAVREYQTRFDRHTVESYRVSPEEAAAAKDALPGDIIETLDFAIRQVTTFAEKQRESMSEWEEYIAPGMRMGHRIVPVEAVGCYAPAGRYPCLTSAVMTVVPAKVAGVERIVACSPPGADGKMNAGILYTMHKMDVDEIYCFGGAQAIGAYAYGTQTIDPVDLVVGPGNQYVAEAKRQVFGDVGIDFIAGPSECLVLSDETGRPDYIAADLIAQCEHDTLARGCLVTTSKALGEQTLLEIDRQLAERTTADTAGASWASHGSVIVTETIEDAARYANEYAPEHLEVHATDPRAIMPMLRNYGSLFLGENTAEVYADKVAGPNHVLPTGRTARFGGGLWVGSYLKTMTHMETDVQASIQLAGHTVTQSNYEKMDAHRYAAAIRLDNLK
ncbi:MAG: histidinol dehydrogenase [Pseudomonadota bacterium]